MRAEGNWRWATGELPLSEMNYPCHKQNLKWTFLAAKTNTEFGFALR
jgi:hypothetical protein